MKWETLKKILVSYQQLLKVVISLMLMVGLIGVFVLRFHQSGGISWPGVLAQLHWLPVLLLLMMVNWSLEALKWQVITDNPRYWDALKVVLLGLLLKQFIPFGIGELSGRMIADRQVPRKEIAGAFMVVGFIQFAVTVTLGCFGVAWLLHRTSYEMTNATLAGLVIAFVGMVIVLLLRRHILSVYNRWFKAVGMIRKQVIRKVAGLSFLRYFVFFLQSLIAFYAFNPLADILLLAAGISFVFLAKTVVPNVGFAGDIGVRGFSAVLFFGYFGMGTVPVVLAGLCIWVINIFLPSFVALFFIRKI